MKKIILLLILMLPIFVNATCDFDMQNEYIKYAYDVSYDSEYIKSGRVYSVILYNVNDKITVKYNGIKYKPNNNKVEINGIKEGTHMEINLYAPSGCEDPIRLIYISQPYYNDFYGSTMCYGYDGKVSYCSYQFIQNKPTEKLVADAIYNYTSSLETIEVEKPKVEVEVTLGEKIVDLIDTKLIKVFMFIFTAYVTYVIYNDLYIKVKHKL